MAATCNSFALKALPAASVTAAASRQLLSLSSFFGVPLPPRKAPILSITGRRALESPSLRLHAAVDDEWGPEPGENSGLAVEEKPRSIADLKQKLKDLLFVTDRGLNASSEMRAEIVELISQIEAKNPTQAPIEALPLLNEKWILAYTSFAQLFPLLGPGRLSELVTVAEVSQTIDSVTFTVQNSVQITGQLATTSVTIIANFEVRSPKHVQIKFEQGIIGTPHR